MTGKFQNKVRYGEYMRVIKIINEIERPHIHLVQLRDSRAASCTSLLGFSINLIAYPSCSTATTVARSGKQNGWAIISIKDPSATFATVGQACDIRLVWGRGSGNTDNTINFY